VVQYRYLVQRCQDVTVGVHANVSVGHDIFTIVAAVALLIQIRNRTRIITLPAFHGILLGGALQLVSRNFEVEAVVRRL